MISFYSSSRLNELHKMMSWHVDPSLTNLLIIIILVFSLLILSHIGFGNIYMLEIFFVSLSPLEKITDLVHKVLFLQDMDFCYPARVFTLGNDPYPLSLHWNYLINVELYYCQRESPWLKPFEGKKVDWIVLCN